MKSLIFTLTLSIVIHILILGSFSKYSNAKTYNNIAVTSENYVEVSIVKPANDGIKNATDFTGSDKISQKNVKYFNMLWILWNQTEIPIEIPIEIS